MEMKKLCTKKNGGCGLELPCNEGPDSAFRVYRKRLNQITGTITTSYAARCHACEKIWHKKKGAEWRKKEKGKEAKKRDPGPAGWFNEKLKPCSEYGPDNMFYHVRTRHAESA